MFFWKKNLKKAYSNKSTPPHNNRDEKSRERERDHHRYHHLTLCLLCCITCHHKNEHVLVNEIDKLTMRIYATKKGICQKLKLTWWEKNHNILQYKHFYACMGKHIECGDRRKGPPHIYCHQYFSLWNKTLINFHTYSRIFSDLCTKYRNATVCIDINVWKIIRSVSFNLSRRPKQSNCLNHILFFHSKN